ncbi:MAG: hypothetical protein Q4A97_11985 [Comamonadaceae bacterium]|nr:hypothetical protein [Comamonadaceae bacterium]
MKSIHAMQHNRKITLRQESPFKTHQSSNWRMKNQCLSFKYRQIIFYDLQEQFSKMPFTAHAKRGPLNFLPFLHSFGVAFG